MLSDGSYYAGLGAYLGAGLFALALLAWWFRRRRGLACWLVCTGAALVLMPAYPEPGMETFAPALIVAAFQLGTDGVAAATHALRPLAVALLAAQLLAVILTLLLRRRGARAP
jgi:hypothetical protein